MCSPVDYFSFSNPVDFHSIGTPHQQSKHWLEKDYDLLVGGGGLLYQGFRGGISFGQDFNILRSPSIVVTLAKFHQELWKRESNRHLGELKDGSEGRYDVWARGSDETVTADMLVALGLVPESV